MKQHNQTLEITKSVAENGINCVSILCNNAQSGLEIMLLSHEARKLAQALNYYAALIEVQEQEEMQGEVKSDLSEGK